MSSLLNIKYIITLVKFLIKRRKENNQIDYKSLKTIFFLANYSNKYNFCKTFFNKYTPVVVQQTQSERLDNSFFEFKKNEIPKSNAQNIFLDSTTFNILKSTNEFTKYFTVDLKIFVKSFFKNLSFIRQNHFFVFKILRIKNVFYIVCVKPIYKTQNFETRKYIPNNFTRKSFVQFLKKEHVNYVVLRWFDNLDAFTSIEEDIDVLLDNNDIDKVFKFLDSNVGLLPIDVYSVNGKKGSSFSGIPYYPPEMASEILKNKVIHSEDFYIPNKKWYLLSLTYHIVFHKSTKSLIPINYENIDNYRDHNYHKVISKALAENQIEIEKITLESLYLILKKFNVAPEYDLLIKLSTQVGFDEWYEIVINGYRKEILIDFNYVKGLCVFLIRERAYNESNVLESKKLLNDFGFELLFEGKITDENALLPSSKIRGGNWGKGDFQISGGIPVYYFVTYDPFYANPSTNILSRYPTLENKKVFLVKDRLRQIFIDNNISKTLFNGIHSSDDFYEAIMYLKYLSFSDEKIKSIISISKQISEEYISPYQVVEDLSRNSSRAKARVINYNGKKAILKTFKKDKLSYLNREVSFLNKFFELDCIPKLYEHNNNYVIMEYFEKAINLEQYGKSLPVDLISEFKKIITYFYNHNYTLIDLNPSNVLLFNGKLKIIDFEFAVEYKNKPTELGLAYELSKLPKGFKGEKPLGIEDISDAYNFYWAKKFSLTKEQFLKL